MLAGLFRALCWTVVFLPDLAAGDPVCFVSAGGSRRVWPVGGGCLLLHGTWSYLRFVGGPCSPTLDFVYVFLDYDHVWHNVNFAFLYASFVGLLVKAKITNSDQSCKSKMKYIYLWYINLKCLYIKWRSNNVLKVIIVQKTHTKSSVEQHRPSTKGKVGSGAMEE